MRLRRQVARRLPPRSWLRSMRRAGQTLCLWLMSGVSLIAAPASAQMEASGTGHWSPAWTDQIISAEFIGPTTRYAHGVLGDAVEWSGLKLTFAGRGGDIWGLEDLLPGDHVFEDMQPRLVDLTLDGRPNAVMVVETDMARGAALALYGATGKIAETPHIGQSNRWLAPIGAADLDGDGHVELAYIDRPHLAKTLRIWRFRNGKLTEIASMPGLTNHQIGQDFITSGIRDCGSGPEIVTVDSKWSRLMSSQFRDGRLNTRDIGRFTGAEALAEVLNCQ